MVLIAAGCSSENGSPADGGDTTPDASMADATEPGTDASEDATIADSGVSEDAQPGLDALPGVDVDPAIDTGPRPDAGPEVDGGASCGAGSHLCGTSCVSDTDVATCGSSCTPCAELPHATATCDGTSCGYTCDQGFDSCDTDPATFCEADLSSDATCGRCGNTCPSWASCVSGQCRAMNDRCGDAIPIDLSSPRSRYDLDITGFASDLPGCAGPGADAFFRFNIAERELVYADTFGSAIDTSLYFADDCTTVTAMSTTGSDAVCSDDACGRPQSQVVALLAPGTHYLVVSGVGGATGMVRLNFEHVTAGLGSVTHLEPGHAVLSGSTSGQGRVFGCQALGPEAAYWWATCPSATAGRLDASLCTGTAFDSVLEVIVPRSGLDLCADDVCGIQASIGTNIPANAGLNVLIVDGLFRTEQGNFSLDVTR